MEDVPPLVLQHILGLVPFKDRRTCRQVCSRWLAETGTSPFVGLSLKIDSRQPGCVAFLKSVFVKEINFVDLILEGNEDTDFWMNLKLYGCRTVVLSGYTSPIFINGNLLRENSWAHLSKLYFCGTFLCQELWKYGEDQPIPPTCSLPNLVSLQFILPLSSIQKCEEAGRERLCELTHQNCSYLLSVIQSPNLKSFHLFLYTSFYWDMEPLQQFIENFGAHLEELVITPMRKSKMGHLVHPPNPYANASRILDPTKMLTNLRSIYYQNLVCTQKFWMDIARNQEHLEEFFVHFPKFPGIGFQCFLKDIVMRNYETLKCLYIISNQNNFSNTVVEVDLAPLSDLRQLEVFVLLSAERNRQDYPGRPCFNSGLVYYRMNYCIKNIHALPHTLKVFNSSFVPDLNFSGARFLQEKPNLEDLELPCITRTGLMKEQSQYSDFIQAALRHRRLNAFKIGFRKALNAPGSVFRKGTITFRHHESGKCIPLASDRLLTILKDEGQMEDVFLGGRFSLMYYRNFFDALDANACPGSSYKQPFYKDSKTPYLKFEELAEQEHCWQFNCPRPQRSTYEDSQAVDFHAVFSRFKAYIEFMRMTKILPRPRDDDTEHTKKDTQSEVIVEYFESSYASHTISKVFQASDSD